MAARECPFCGNDIPSYKIACPSCGHVIGKEGSSKSPDQQVRELDQGRAESGGKNALIINTLIYVIAICILTVIGYRIYDFVTMDRTGPEGVTRTDAIEIAKEDIFLDVDYANGFYWDIDQRNGVFAIECSDKIRTIYLYVGDDGIVLDRRDGFSENQYQTYQDFIRRPRTSYPGLPDSESHFLPVIIFLIAPAALGILSFIVLIFYSYTPSKVKGRIDQSDGQ